MENTNIGWAHDSVNFWRGCTPVSDECQNCWAKTMMENKGEPFAVRIFRVEAAAKEALKLNEKALKAGKRRVVFTLSMGDFFDPLGDDVRARAWEVIKETPMLDWMILTKRPHLIEASLPSDWGERGWDNVWLGTTCGTRKPYRCAHTHVKMTPFDRVDILRRIPARIRFISAEPLLEDISDLDLTGIHWLAAGGESGPEWNKPYRRMDIAWAAKLFDRCAEFDAAYLFKQVSAFKSEQGVNALALYLAERDGVRVDPATCDLHRNWPVQYLDHELAPFRETGTRFNLYDWREYKEGLIVPQLVMPELVQIRAA